MLRLRLALAEGADRHGRAAGELVVFHRLFWGWLLRVHLRIISARLGDGLDDGELHRGGVDVELDDDEVGGDSGTGGVSTHEDKSTVSAKAVTTAAAKKKADTFAQLTSKEELSQAKLILVNDRA